MVGNINNAKMKMLAERDLLLIILRGRKREYIYIYIKNDEMTSVILDDIQKRKIME